MLSNKLPPLLRTRQQHSNVTLVAPFTQTCMHSSRWLVLTFVISSSNHRGPSATALAVRCSAVPFRNEEQASAATAAAAAAESWASGCTVLASDAASTVCWWTLRSAPLLRFSMKYGCACRTKSTKYAKRLLENPCKGANLHKEKPTMNAPVPEMLISTANTPAVALKTSVALG